MDEKERIGKELRKQLAYFRWRERYENQEHQSFDDDLPYVQNKCYDFADEILALVKEPGYRLPVLTLLKDGEKDAAENKLLKEKYHTKWSDFCGWFKSGVAIEGEQVVIDLTDAVIQAQFSHSKKELGIEE